MTLEVRKGDQRKVLIFRNELLPRSETFILAQSQALTRFMPVFGAVHRAKDSLDLPSEPILLDANSNALGKVRRRLFWKNAFGPKFYRRFKDMNLDLMHVHFAVDGAAALPISVSLGIPMVVSLHGYDVTCSDETLVQTTEGRVYLRRRQWLWDHASKFICISKYIYERAIERGFPKEKLSVLYTGTDLSMFSGVECSREREIIVFVGRLVEKKGLAFLLDAMHFVKLHHPSARLVVLGSGSLEGELKARSMSEGIRCSFLGMQTASAVRAQLARARVLCVPSVSARSGDSEGLGMVFVEAQAMGTPVVSFKHGGIPEVVLDGVTGLLAPERDRIALGESLSKLMGDDEMWSRMSIRARKWAQEAFDLKRQTDLLEDLYEDVLRKDSRLAKISR
jgi:glycosyltransferase involved in cell wall biosynthesis